MKEKAFAVTVLGLDASLEMPPRTIQLLPTHLYVFPNGSKSEEMSFAWVLSTGDSTPVVVAQISARMLIEEMPKQTAQSIRKMIEEIHP